MSIKLHVELALILPFVVVFAFLGVPLLYMRWKRYRLRRAAARGGQIHLTFDDGPGPCTTPRVLDWLDKAGIKATFFLMGRQVEKNPALVTEILRRGHSIGCHSYEHQHPWYNRPWRAIGDIRRGWASVTTATGIDASGLPFRPPYGKLNLLTLIYLLFKRTPIATWTISSGDTQMDTRSPDAAAQLVAEQGGGVVLFHDFDHHDPRHGEWVLTSLDAIAEVAPQSRFSTFAPAGSDSEGKEGRGRRSLAKSRGEAG